MNWDSIKFFFGQLLDLIIKVSRQFLGIDKYNGLLTKIKPYLPDGLFGWFGTIIYIYILYKLWKMSIRLPAIASLVIYIWYWLS